MHFLARWLNTDVDVSRELASGEQEVQAELQRFLRSFTVKQRVLKSLLQGESIHVHLHTLQYALTEELELIEESERREKEILADLKYLSRERYIKNLETLLQELHEAKTQDEYIKKILEELHDTLLSEARKVKRLLAGDPDLSLRQTVIDLLTIERHLVEKLSAIEDFRQLFRNLYLGTARREAVSSIEKRYHDKISELVQSVEVGPDGTARSPDGHYISELSARVFNKLQDAVMHAVADGSIAGHPNTDKEYVNSELFEKFVRDEIKVDRSVGKCVPSERTTQAFIRAFRHLYLNQLRRVAA